MTYAEKLRREYYSLDKALARIFEDNCPEDLGYRKQDDILDCDMDCAKCWDQEIPETMVTVGEDISDDPNRKVDTLVKAPGTSEFAKEASEAFRKMSETISKTGEISALLKNAVSSIKDSGDRTQFETGAVRDMREGKGRCDLMPLEVVACLMVDPAAKEMLQNISSFQEYNDTRFLYSCLSNFATGYGHDSFLVDECTMLLEVAKHFEEGAKKYGENNWQKGIPVKCYIDSAVRHYLKWLRGDKDEPHDRAFVWNLMCCIWEVDYREKTNDVPKL